MAVFHIYISMYLSNLPIIYIVYVYSDFISYLQGARNSVIVFIYNSYISHKKTYQVSHIRTFQQIITLRLKNCENCKKPHTQELANQGFSNYKSNIFGISAQKRKVLNTHKHFKHKRKYKNISQVKGVFTALTVSPCSFGQNLNGATA